MQQSVKLLFSFGQGSQGDEDDADEAVGAWVAFVVAWANEDAAVVAAVEADVFWA